MNTLLHVFEAYTELYRITGDENLRKTLYAIIRQWKDKIWNPKLERQEVFFDRNFNSIIDLYSYGHDIEATWLIDLACETIGDAELIEKFNIPLDEYPRRCIKQIGDWEKQREEIFAGGCGKRPVIVLTAAVNTKERLFV